MKRFLGRLAAFVAIQIVIAAAVFALYHPSPQNIMASTIDKHRLLDETPSPRLVLIGGSSVLFGTISDTLATRLPYHPVNMSIAAGLGAGFMLNEARDGLRPGDVALVSIEYEEFGITGRPETVLRLLSSRPQSVRYVPLDYWPAILDFGLSYTGIIVRSSVGGLHGRQEPLIPPNVRFALNTFGDDSLRPPTPKVPPVGIAVYADGRLPSHFGAVLEQINRFADFCRARGVRAYFIHPPVPETRWRLHAPEIALAESVFVKRMRMPLLDTQDGVIFPDRLFYDTEYHLTAEGAALRTQMLVKELGSRLAADGVTASGH
ncbi:MAG TPA: hypothetical protein VL332_09350 [Candidatus Saccharimonadaceae bacterium]|jgi:hypothetical protein|nr:hypothetical protein [Candidatus Saccharimonadaceae bacterium]